MFINCIKTAEEERVHFNLNCNVTTINCLLDEIKIFNFKCDVI